VLPFQTWPDGQTHALPFQVWPPEQTLAHDEPFHEVPLGQTAVRDSAGLEEVPYELETVPVHVVLPGFEAPMVPEPLATGERENEPPLEPEHETLPLVGLPEVLHERT